MKNNILNPSFGFEKSIKGGEKSPSSVLPESTKSRLLFILKTKSVLEEELTRLILEVSQSNGESPEDLFDSLTEEVAEW